jgi:hypothetical protein
MRVTIIPLSRGGALTVRLQGCVNKAKEHTPTPLSRGESHWPGFNVRPFSYFSIAKHALIILTSDSKLTLPEPVKHSNRTPLVCLYHFFHILGMEYSSHV